MFLWYYARKMIWCMVCFINRGGGGGGLQANNPQEYNDKAAQAIPAEVHMFRYQFKFEVIIFQIR